MPPIVKEVLLPDQVVRLKTLDRFASLFGQVPRRLIEPELTYLLISIKSGSGHCLVDNKYVPLTAGSLLLVNPYSYLHLENTQYLLGSVIIFMEAFFCKEPASAVLLYKVAFGLEAKPIMNVRDQSIKLQFVQANVHMFAVEYRMRKGNNTIINDFLWNLLHGLLLFIHKEQLLQSGKNYDSQDLYQQYKFSEFIKLVNQHFKTHHNLEFYALEMGMSVTMLGRMCKEVSDLTAKEIILSKLIEEAKTLLTYDPRPLNDIGFELGFSEYGAFNSFIRQQLHATPSDVRKHSAFHY